MGERNNHSGDTAFVIAGNLFNLMTAVIIGLVMPLCVSVETYAGYRTYTLYISYVSLFHLGLVNGVALRYGQMDYVRLPYGLFRGFTRVLMLMELGFVLVLFAAATFCIGYSQMTPVHFVIVNLFAANLRNYYTTVDRFSGRFRMDAIVLILYDTALLTGLGILMSRRPENVQSVLFFITLLNLALTGCMACLNREITFGRPAVCSAAELSETIRRGSYVMTGEIIGALVLGIDSIFVQIVFDARHFSEYSFAVYIITAACTALSACDNLIFPALKRLAPDSLRESYRKLLRRAFLGCGVMLIPVFLCAPLIRRFLPVYAGSISILLILSPVLVFRTLSILVCRNILLVLDQEKVFMRNNAAALVLGFFLDLLAVFFQGEMHAIAAVSVLTFAVWFFLNDWSIRSALRRGEKR